MSAKENKLKRWIKQLDGIFGPNTEAAKHDHATLRRMEKRKRNQFRRSVHE